MNPQLESFYKGILSYAGLEYDSSANLIKNKGDKFGDFLVNGKKLTLPYEANLRHPNGRSIFHPLNENFLSPESPQFLLYKKRLTVELNLRLSSLIVVILNIANSIDIQNKLTDPKLISLISSIKDPDMVMTENFLAATKKSMDKNDAGFIFDIFLKKNGEVKGTPFSATGKIVFTMPKEILKCQEAPTKENHLFGAKLRLVDLAALKVIFEALFGEPEMQAEYIEGTNNKVFRYLNALLTSSYMVSSVIDKTLEVLKPIDDGSLGLSEAAVDLEWLKQLPTVYTLTDVIRRIPNQDEMPAAKVTAQAVNRASLNEAAVEILQPAQQAPVQQQPAPQQHSYYSQPAPVQQQPVQQPPQQQQPMTLLQSLEASSTARMPYPQQYMQQMYQRPQVPLPAWVVQDEMARQMQANPQAYPQQMYPQSAYPQQVYQQPYPAQQYPQQASPAVMQQGPDGNWYRVQ